MFRSVTWSQVVLCLGLIAAGGLSIKFLGGDSALIVNSVLMLLAYLRDPKAPAPAKEDSAE